MAIRISLSGRAIKHLKGRNRIRRHLFGNNHLQHSESNDYPRQEDPKHAPEPIDRLAIYPPYFFSARMILIAR